MCNKLYVSKITKLKSLLEKLLQSQVNIYTTNCIKIEAKNIGDEIHQKCKPILNICELYECAHKKGELSATECILDLIDRRKKKFMIATQDKQLQNKLKYRPLPIPTFTFSHGQIMPIKIEQKQLDEMPNDKPEVFASYNYSEAQPAQMDGANTVKKSKKIRQAGLKNHAILNKIIKLDEKIKK